MPTSCGLGRTVAPTGRLVAAIGVLLSTRKIVTGAAHHLILREYLVLASAILRSRFIALVRQTHAIGRATFSDDPIRRIALLID